MDETQFERLLDRIDAQTVAQCEMLANILDNLITTRENEVMDKLSTTEEKIKYDTQHFDCRAFNETFNNIIAEYECKRFGKTCDKCNGILNGGRCSKV
jgi:hypothetical protein